MNTRKLTELDRIVHSSSSFCFGFGDSFHWIVLLARYQLPVTAAMSRNENEIMMSLVHNVNELSPGDHVAYYRDYLVLKLEHHAIVESVDVENGHYSIIEYTGSPVKVDGNFASVRKTTLSFVNNNKMYRIDYDHCLPPEITLMLANERIGEAEYRILKNNCEHFATYCKTRTPFCRQEPIDIFQRSWTTSFRVIMKVLEEGATGLAICFGKKMPKDIALKLAKFGIECSPGILSTAEKDLITVSVKNFARAFQLGTIGFGVVVNVLVDVYDFYRMKKKYRKQWESGEITLEIRDQKISEAAWENGIGCGLSVAGAFLGQALIPVPFLGCICGSLLGNMIGRRLGSFIAAKVKSAWII